MTEYIVDMYCEQSGVKCERIVRCRDCKHSFVTRKGKTLCVIARHVYYDLFREVNPNGYCAWGEQKEVVR